MKRITLNQFGSIVSFAVELENSMSKFYENNELSELHKSYSSEFNQRAKSCSKRSKNLLRSRRENITEITLEPIEGLISDDFVINVDNFSLESINLNENIVCEFYEKASSKINVLETKRLFKRYLKEHLNLKTLN